jgi:membrane protein involved in D-alanine export
MVKNLAGGLLTLLPLFLVKLHLNNHWGMIGLSFMTFRAVDVLLYRSKKEGQNFLHYFCYLFMPFIILAGPMYRWRTWMSDVSKPVFALNREQFLVALEQIITGIVQKFLFAMLVDSLVVQPWSHKPFTLTVGVVMSIAYSAYLYFDFAGYSNMAIGAGRLFGLNIPANFNMPHLAKNPQDFWRRFHISLSEWLRDVVFMPVYMNLMKFNFFRQNKTLAQNIGIFAPCSAWGHGMAWNAITSSAARCLAPFPSLTTCCCGQPNAARRCTAVAVSGRCVLGRILTLGSAAASLYIFSGMSPL